MQIPNQLGHDTMTRRESQWRLSERKARLDSVGYGPPWRAGRLGPPLNASSQIADGGPNDYSVTL